MSQSTIDYNEIKYFKMSSFRLGKLPEIQESLEEKGLDYATFQWILQEKLHGSNSCFIHEYQNGTPEIKLGRRNGLVPEKELKSFFNIGEAYRPYMQSLTNLVEAVCYERGLDYRNHRVTIYSELYGNNIQKGMLYHEKETIAVFDIRVDNTFLSYQDVEKQCYRHSLPLAPMVMKGTLDKLVPLFRPLLEDMKSIVPNMLHNQNIMDAPAEGVIVRPYDMEETFDPYDKDYQMLRYKWKKMEFSERPTKKEVFPGDAKSMDLLISSAAKFINTSRLHTYLSKVGHDFILDKKNMGQNIRALFQDAMLDIEQEEEYQPIFQEKKLVRQLRQKMNQEASNVIQTYQFEYTPVIGPPTPVQQSDEALLKRLDTHIYNTQVTIDKIREAVLALQQKNMAIAS